MTRLAIWLFVMTATIAVASPVRLVVVGMEHGHVGWILGHGKRDDIELVGVVEPDAARAKRVGDRFHLAPELIRSDLEYALDELKPDAVCVFTSIDRHLPVIRACAERGIDVMVEKPLAVSSVDAHQIASLAKEHGIQVLTNYETTWYPSVAEAERIVSDDQIGPIRKIVAHDGHSGPKEIGCGPDFLEWLLGSESKGGGALIDFGCYGADLITWLMKGEKPVAVTAVTQKLKSDPAYANVDDEATVILTYPTAQGIIQGSWNWPFNRKDLEIYGTKGSVFADDSSNLRVRFEGEELATKNAGGVRMDCFAYLAKVVRGEIDPTGSLSSLPINVTVVEILEAARRSADTGSTIKL